MLGNFLWCVPRGPDLLEKLVIDFFALELLPHFFSLLDYFLFFFHPDLFLDKFSFFDLLNTSLFLRLSIPSDFLIQNLLILSID